VTDEELDALFAELGVMLSAAGLGWVVDQVNGTIRPEWPSSGRSRLEKFVARIYSGRSSLCLRVALYPASRLTQRVSA